MKNERITLLSNCGLFCSKTSGFMKEQEAKELLGKCFWDL